MMKLTEFLIAAKIPLNLENYKIHLATSKSYPPLDAFYEGKFKEWQENQRNKNFQCDMVISLIELRKNKWLFAGVYKILGHEKNGNQIKYRTKLLPNQENLVGRLIIHHQRKFRQAYLKGKKNSDNFFISELKEKRLILHDFPGYHSVLISYRQLKSIVEQNIESWYGALSNLKGVYLITDTVNGKLYVGSAIGSTGIWQRWNDYVKSGHGGNKMLKKILKLEGNSYKFNFQFSILEIGDSHASDDYILERESYWKNVLRSREFGLNSN
ncbi:GIY-YIG nuclease family protein [Candidatus Riflebacteria bacterium]